MIDTLRLRIPLDLASYASAQNKCVRFTSASPNEAGYRKDNYSKTLVIKPHRAKIRVSLFKEECMFVEFSVPKYWFGHNVLLFDPKDLPLVLDDLKNRLEDTFEISTLPDYLTWRIQRVDICYAWKFNSNEEARLALASMKPYELPRKDQVIYDTTVWYKGNSFSSKFYLKHDEFLQGDYKELMKWGDSPFADGVAQMGDGVLRFEVEMRKGKLDSVFKKDIFPQDIMDTDKIHVLLCQFLSDITKTIDTSLMDLAKVSRLITVGSTRRQAWELFSFYRIYSSNNPVDHEILKLLPKATYYAKIKQIKALGVGIYDQDSRLAFAFDIPSIYEVSDAQEQDA